MHAAIVFPGLAHADVLVGHGHLLQKDLESLYFAFKSFFLLFDEFLADVART